MLGVVRQQHRRRGAQGQGHPCQGCTQGPGRGATRVFPEPPQSWGHPGCGTQCVRYQQGPSLTPHPVLSSSRATRHPAGFSGQWGRQGLYPPGTHRQGTASASKGTHHPRGLVEMGVSRGLRVCRAGPASPWATRAPGRRAGGQSLVRSGGAQRPEAGAADRDPGGRRGLERERTPAHSPQHGPEARRTLPGQQANPPATWAAPPSTGLAHAHPSAAWTF